MVRAARRVFTLHDKLNYIDQVETYGIAKVSKMFSIDKSCLKRWRSAKPRILAASRRHSNSRTRVGAPGRQSLISVEVQIHLVSYFESSRSQEKRVSISMMLRELHTTDASLLGVSNRTLRRRIWRVLDRNGIVRRRVTHQAQNTRLSNEVMEDWQAYILRKQDMFGIIDANVANFDETNVYFAPDSAETLNKKGERTVSVRKADCSMRCTAMIGVSMLGEKLPPYIIYQGSEKVTGRIKRDMDKVNEEREVKIVANGFDSLEGKLSVHGYSLEQVYAVQSKAWMDERLMLDWIAKVWKPWAEKRVGPKMLIIDEFRAHMTGNVRRAIEECDTFLEFIPGGYTSKLQVMDVGLNKPFKDKVREGYEGWYMSVEATSKPTRLLVSNWIWSSWTGITHSTMLNAWRKVGLRRMVDTRVVVEAEEEEEGTNTGDGREPIVTMDDDDSLVES